MGKEIRKLIIFLVLLFSIRIIDFVFGYINSIVMLHLNYKLNKEISNKIINNTIKKKDIKKAEVDKLLRSEVSAFIVFITSNVPQLVFSCLKVICACVMMFFMQWKISVVVVSIEIGTIFLYSYLNSRVLQMGKVLRELVIDQITKIAEVVDNIRFTKYIHAQEYVTRRFNGAIYATYTQDSMFGTCRFAK